MGADEKVAAAYHPGTGLVRPDRIETIVGARRQRRVHLGRAIKAEKTVYILHPHECRDSGIDLRECPYSVALEHGIEPAAWRDLLDEPVLLAVTGGRLLPARVAALRVAEFARKVQLDLLPWQLDALALALAGYVDRVEEVDALARRRRPGHERR